MDNELGNETDIDLLLVSPVTSPANFALIGNDDFTHYGILITIFFITFVFACACTGMSGSECLQILSPNSL